MRSQEKKSTAEPELINGLRSRKDTRKAQFKAKDAGRRFKNAASRAGRDIVNKTKRAGRMVAKDIMGAAEPSFVRSAMSEGREEVPKSQISTFKKASKRARMAPGQGVKDALAKERRDARSKKASGGELTQDEDFAGHPRPWEKRSAKEKKTSVLRSRSGFPYNQNRGR